MLIDDMEIEQLRSTVVVSGAAPAYELAFKATQIHGRIIAIGVPRSAIQVDVLSMILRDLSLIATNQGTKQELAEALEMAALHKIKPYYELRQLDQINDGFQDMIGGRVQGRLVYKMT